MYRPGASFKNASDNLMRCSPMPVFLSQMTAAVRPVMVRMQTVTPLLLPYVLTMSVPDFITGVSALCAGIDGIFTEVTAIKNNPYLSVATDEDWLKSFTDASWTGAASLSRTLPEMCIPVPA
jgi:hypothetical protein